MNFTIICVNHNSYDELERYLESISNAAQRASCDVIVAIADNTPIDLRQSIRYHYPNIEVRQYMLDHNNGYLNDADVVMTKLRGEDILDSADLCIISNVDLKLSDDFFVNLLYTPTPQDTGWIAPDICTLTTGRHENPFMQRRPTIYNFWFWRTLYRLPHLFRLYSNLAKRYRPQRSSTQAMDRREIYAGHGSIMIFTNAFIKNYITGKFPAFMYGEEIFFAELVQQFQLKTLYYPNLVVYNIGGVSTNQLGLRRKAKMNYESLTALQQLFFS